MRVWAFACGRLRVGFCVWRVHVRHCSRLLDVARVCVGDCVAMVCYLAAERISHEWRIRKLSCVRQCINVEASVP